ncbi:MAG: NAD-binding protein [Rhodocyclales bacterium]|nr:NAD-binding protein [Rhodocyclales bacterium]
MTPLARHHSIFFLIMRRLRAPLLALIVIFAISILGLTLAPGAPDATGRPTSLSFFHAFYFVSYTATTIGFGEIPESFSDQQRLWVIVCIYMSVAGWAYTLSRVFALLSDRNLQQAISTQRFLRAVNRLGEPFYLVCGYGETGRLVVDALDRLRYRVVVVDSDERALGESELQAYAADVPALCADAGNPEILKFAGLTHPRCVGVLALTNDDNANLAIAIAARLLAPRLPVLCRAETRETAVNMASFSTRHVINPFEKFSEYLALALRNPAAWQLLIWLTGLPGTTVDRHRAPPHGAWVVCGHGRFGRLMVEAMEGARIPVTIIDLAARRDFDHPWVRGDGTGAQALQQANIMRAAGIIASTHNDVDNLSVAVTARELNPDLFVIVRQNQAVNHALFDAFDSDVTMVPSKIIAHECLAVLTTPLMVPFLEAMKGRDEPWCATLLERMTECHGWAVPSVWSVRIDLSQTPALYLRLMQGASMELGTLLRPPHDHTQPLACEVLYLSRDDGDDILMPDRDTRIRAGDELLLVGTPAARNDLGFTLGNEFALHYVLTGEELARGWIWRYLTRPRKTITAATRRDPVSPDRPPV